ncbi:MAG: transposase [Pseudomonadota bacterium]
MAVEVDHQPPTRKNQAVGGVDLGIKALATISDGHVFPGPRALATNLVKLKRLSRAQSRKRKGSANRRKAKVKIARLHARMSRAMVFDQASVGRAHGIDQARGQVIDQGSGWPSPGPRN